MGIVFSAHVFTGIGRRAAIISRGKKVSTQDCLKIIAVGYKQWVTAANYIALQIEVTVSTFSLIPVTSHAREAATRSVPAARKAGVWYGLLTGQT